MKSVQGWHIVNTDNYGDDYPAERFLMGWKDEEPHNSLQNLEWTDHPDLAQVWADHPSSIALAINKAWGEHSTRYAKVVKKGYVLQPGFEP